MAVIFVVTILLGVGCINDLVNLVWAQDGCISHPLPPEVVDKIVAAANIAITQTNGSNCSCNEDNKEAVDSHALATPSLLQNSLTAAFSASKKDWDNVSSLLSSTVNELAATKKELENAVARISSLQSTQRELAASKKDWDNVLTEIPAIQSSVAALRNESVELQNNYETVLTEIPAIQSSVAALRNESAELQNNCETVLTEIPAIQSSVAALRNELAELQNNYKTGTSKSPTCKDSWLLFQNSCYFFSNTTDTWEGGRQRCRSVSADYVKISTDAEFAFIRDHVVDNTWIGLNDLQSEGTFSWISDGTVQEMNEAWWNANQPDDHQGKEDCVHLKVSGSNRFNDIICTKSFLYVCEMMPETTNS